MQPAAILDRLESSPSNPSFLTELGKIPDLGEEFFNRIIKFYGSDPKSLQSLGRFWVDLLHAAEDTSWVYRAAGIYERSFGRWQKSADCFLEAGASSKARVLKLSFQVGAIDSLARNGELEEAEKLVKLHRGLLKAGQPGLAARAMLNLGNALIYQDRMPEARKVLSKTLPLLLEGGLELEALSAQLALSSTCLYGGFPAEAVTHAEAVMGAAGAKGENYLASLASLNLAFAKAVTGRPEGGFEILNTLAPEFAASPVDLALSACETGSLSLATKFEPDGLARAFIARGAQSVVASQWALDDEAGYRHFSCLFDSLLAGAPIQQALFDSKCICRDWKSHPYYWGALALYLGFKS